jgi:hypothetical protein
VAAERSGWRACFDAFERAVGRPLEAGVQTDAFQDAVASTTRLQAAVQDRLERASSEFLHMLNLPARSDLNHLSDQLSRLDRQARDLSLELEKRSTAARRAGRRR